MFDDLDAPFEQAFPQTPESKTQRPLRLRKTSSQLVAFWGTNCLVMPIVALCYLAVSAEGLRQIMTVFSMRLYKLPVPGAGLLQNYDGWNRLDLSTAMAMLLFGAITYIWYRVFTELMGSGDFLSHREKNPILFYLLAAIIGVLLLGDSAIFYFGLQSKASTGWGNTPEYVPAMATIIYMAGLALVGAWHADYHHSGTV